MALAFPVIPSGTACAFDREPHLYTINGIVTPSVTQVLSEEKFIDFSMVPDETLAQAQARGTYVHAVLHYLREEGPDGKPDFDLDDCDPRFRGYVDSGLEYMARLKKVKLRDSITGKVAGVEFRFWHLRRFFAGTIDDVGWDEDGVLAIDDYKTGEPTDVAAALQTAAYEVGLREGVYYNAEGELVGPLFPNHKKLIRRRAVKLFKDGKPGRAEPYTDARDLSQFYAALTCVHFRRNRCEHTRGAA